MKLVKLTLKHIALVILLATLAVLCICLLYVPLEKLADFGTFLGGVLGGVGAISATFIAYLALNNWKSQSRGESTLNRLLICQEYVSILCCEFLDRTTGLTGKEREELYEVAKNLDNNLAILSRQISPNDEILAMKKLAFMPKVRIRDFGVLWDAEKENLLALEVKLNNYLANN